LELEIYRAKQVRNPCPEFPGVIGTLIDPKKHLEDLRTSYKANLIPRVPSGPNSGLSVRIKD